MPAFATLPQASTHGLYPGHQFGMVWDSVGPPHLPKDVADRLQEFLDTLVRELLSRLPAGTTVERDTEPNKSRIFITSLPRRRKKAGLAVNIDLQGSATLIIYLRRFLPWSRFHFLPFASRPTRATPLHHEIADELQAVVNAALEATFPDAAPFKWREDGDYFGA